MILYDSYVSGSLTIASSVTASSGAARNVIIAPTLVASANGDSLVGLLISPSFNAGAFTGVTQSDVTIAGNGVLNISSGNGIIRFNNNNWLTTNSTDTRTYLQSGGLYHIWFAAGGSEIARLNTNGNLVLQNGGTFTDNGYRLQVNGLGAPSGSVFISGTTISDYPTLGSELLTTGDGTSWSGSAFSTGYAHTTGSVIALTSSLAAINGAFYQTSITVAGRTSGSFSFTFGGATTTSVSSTTSFALAAISTGSFALTPSTDFNGTASVSLKQITVASTPTLIISNTATSSVLSNLEIRVPSGSSGNTFIGYRSGRFNTTATGNTFLGYQAGSVNMGPNNTFIGTNAGLNNTTGNSNVFIGNGTGQNNTTGYNNTIINTALSSMQTGGENIIMGFFAGRFNTSGGSNIFLGRDSGRDGVSTSNNIFIGLGAGSFLTSGANNIFFGIGAGQGFAGSTSNLLTTSSNSILIGGSTYTGGNSQTNQIVIGIGTTGLGSNTTVLGNSSTTTTAIYGNLSLGSTVDAGYKLDVTGTARVSGAATFSSTVTSQTGFKLPANGNGTSPTLAYNNSLGFGVSGTGIFFGNLYNSDLTTSMQLRVTNAGGTDITAMTLLSSGNVGISTTTPGYKLDVNGDFKSGTSYLTGNTTFFSTAVSGPLNYGGSTIRIVGGTGTSASGIQFGPADSNATGARGRIGFVASANNGNPKEFAIIKGVLDSTGANTCNGSLTFHTLNGDNATEAATRMTIDGNGSIGAPSGTNIYNASDIRLKQNVFTIGEGLASILALNPIKFNWIDNFVPSENGKNMLGFIAQEVQEVIPEAVEAFGGNSITVGDTTIENPLRVNEKYIIPLLVKAIQELSAEIELLKNK
jgi:hypothetical protein